MKGRRRQPPGTLLRDTRGLTTVEYIIILCLVAVVGFSAWDQFGQTVKEKTQNSRDTLQTGLQDAP